MAVADSLYGVPDMRLGKTSRRTQNAERNSTQTPIEIALQGENIAVQRLFGESGITERLFVKGAEMKDFIRKKINKASINYPVTRADLCNMTGLSDRIVRRIIAELRQEGNWIINRGNGYYRGRSESDRKYLIADYNSRIVKMAKTVRALENKVGGQYELL